MKFKFLERQVGELRDQSLLVRWRNHFRLVLKPVWQSGLDSKKVSLACLTCHGGNPLACSCRIVGQPLPVQRSQRGPKSRRELHGGALEHDLQSGWRLRQVHRAGGLCADRAAASAGRRVAIDGGRVAQPAGGAFASVLGRGVALLRLFNARAAAAIVRPCHVVRAGDELHGPGSGRPVRRPATSFHPISRSTASRTQKPRR